MVSSHIRSRLLARAAEVSVEKRNWSFQYQSPLASFSRKSYRSKAS